MRTLSVIVTVILIVSAHESSSLTLNGRVLDRESKPVSGVHLALAGNNLSTTTDSMGNFSINPLPVRHQPRFSTHYNNVCIEGNSLNIDTDSKGEFKVSIVDSRGCKRRVMPRYSSAGHYRGIMDKSGDVSGLLFVTIESARSGEKITCRLLNGFSRRLLLS